MFLEIIGDLPIVSNNDKLLAKFLSCTSRITVPWQGFQLKTTTKNEQGEEEERRETLGTSESRLLS